MKNENMEIGPGGWSDNGSEANDKKDNYNYGVPDDGSDWDWL